MVLCVESVAPLVGTSSCCYSLPKLAVSKGISKTTLHGAIAGGVCSVVVVLLITGILWRRRKRRNAGTKDSVGESAHADVSTAARVGTYNNLLFELP